MAVYPRNVSSHLYSQHLVFLVAVHLLSSWFFLFSLVLPVSEFPCQGQTYSHNEIMKTEHSNILFSLFMCPHHEIETDAVRTYR